MQIITVTSQDWEKINSKGDLNNFRNSTVTILYMYLSIHVPSCISEQDTCTRRIHVEYMHKVIKDWTYRNNNNLRELKYCPIKFLLVSGVNWAFT